MRELSLTNNSSNSPEIRTIQCLK
jgi:hypothetical protein